MKDLEKRLRVIEEKLGIVNGATKLEVGKWYKLLENGSIAFLGSIDTFTYGISMAGAFEWIGYPTPLNKTDQWVEATTQEVEEALVRNAELKYSGKKGKCLHSGYDLVLEDVIKWDWDNMSLRYQLNNTYWGCVYCLGEWAEVIEPQQSSLEQDIQQLKDKYKQYKFTITIEDNI